MSTAYDEIRASMCVECTMYMKPDVMGSKLVTPMCECVSCMCGTWAGWSWYVSLKSNQMLSWIWTHTRPIVLLVPSHTEHDRAETGNHFRYHECYSLELKYCTEMYLIILGVAFNLNWDDEQKGNELANQCPSSLMTSFVCWISSMILSMF